MAAVTSSIVALGGLGLSVAQAAEGAKNKKAANAAASQAAANLKSIKEVDNYAAIQSPDISKLAYEQSARSQAASIEALKGMGPEGAAQVAKLEQIARETDLKTAQSQAQMDAQTDMAIATGQQGIEQRRAGREAGAEWGALQGAQNAAVAGQEQMVAGITGAFGAAGNLATGLGEATSLEAQAQRNAKKQAQIQNGAPTTSTAALGQINNPLFQWGGLKGLDLSSAYDNPLEVDRSYLDLTLPK